jgi:hypothetical protein
MSGIKHRAFFGDAERDFALTPELILELERKSGKGIGRLAHDLRNWHFAYADMAETVRLAMIGGGTKPEEAAALMKAYAAKPQAELYKLALDITEVAWFGKLVTEAAPDQPEASSDA